MNNAKRIGENVRLRRSQLGYTQDDLRKRMGYASLASISKIENGNFKPTSDIMANIAGALSTTSFALGYTDTEESQSNTLGRNIKERRKELKLTQEDLRKKIGYTSTGTLSQIERGFFVPPINTIKTIAEILQTDVGKLMSEPEKESRPRASGDASKIPVYTTGESFENRTYADRPSGLFCSGSCCAICVSDNDMQGSGIAMGDFLFLSQNCKTKNYIGGFSYNGTVIVRRACSVGENILLICDHKPPVSIPNADTSLKHLGAVVSVLRKFQ